MRRTTLALGAGANEPTGSLRMGQRAGAFPVSAGASRKDHDHPWAHPSPCPPRTGFGPGGSDPSPIPRLPRVAGSKAMLEKAGSCCLRGAQPECPHSPECPFPPPSTLVGACPAASAVPSAKLLSPRSSRGITAAD